MQQADTDTRIKLNKISVWYIGLSIYQSIISNKKYSKNTTPKLQAFTITNQIQGIKCMV